MEYKDLLRKILFSYVNKELNALLYSTSDNLSLNMFKYMDVIYTCQKITPSKLAESLGVSRAASSKMIKRLTKLGYIDSLPTTSGKSYEVQLTDKAYELYSVIDKQDNEFIELLDKYLELSQIKDIDNRLVKLYDAYEEESGKH